MTRSKARPTAPATAMAASMARKTAPKLSTAELLPVQSARPANTLVATKAPRAMKTPWPKFSTSIRPKTRVRPEAMMKMIMPIARPAMVRVTQVVGEPISGKPAAARPASSTRGFQSNSTRGMAATWVGSLSPREGVGLRAGCGPEAGFAAT